MREVRSGFVEYDYLPYNFKLFFPSAMRFVKFYYFLDDVLDCKRS